MLCLYLAVYLKMPDTKNHRHISIKLISNDQKIHEKLTEQTENEKNEFKWDECKV